MIYIVVSIFNRHERVEELLNQLVNQDYTQWLLYVVDHGDNHWKGSNDPRVIVLRGSSELWWSGAMNLGISRIIQDKKERKVPILVINDDLIINSSDYLRSMYNAWLINPNGLFGSVCLNENGIVTYCNMILDKKSARFIYLNAGDSSLKLNEKLYDSDVLKGRGTLISSHVFEKIGLFEEGRLPHYKADHEFTYRAKLSGFDVQVLTNAKITAVLDGPVELSDSKGIRALKNVLFSRRSVVNLIDLYYFSFLCFKAPYSFYFFAVNLSRIIMVNILNILRHK